MNLSVEELDNGIEVINLNGRMDLAGALEIDAQFTSLASAGRGLLLVDLSNVGYLASIGIRTLLNGAKARKQQGGGVAICGAQMLVAKVLEMAGMRSIAPVFTDRRAGIAGLLAKGNR
jgi:anti-sigma B factor antagonist